MNNRLVFSIALLFSMPTLFGRLSFEEAQQKLSHVEGRRHQLIREIKELDAKAQGTHKALQAKSSQEAYGKDIERYTSLVRSRIDRREQLRAQLDGIDKERQQVIGEVGRRFAVSLDESAGRYTVARPQEPTRSLASGE